MSILCVEWKTLEPCLDSRRRPQVGSPAVGRALAGYCCPSLRQPKIVEALLGYEIVQLACGASHVLAVSNDREVFAWGRGDNGRLGLGSLESYSSPQQVALPPEQEAHRVLCGIDASMVLTVQNRILACGSNR
nr:serine/threonine-protein kinase Nek8-like [Pelodiscus sinensis]|eukprot:XP_025038329.1 serine/threonine-protein kinase Nek8-like [Pelodiscus sinensis]